MKFFALVVSSIALAAIAQTHYIDPAQIPEGEPALIRSLKKLHQGPPEQLETSRADIKTEWISQKLDHFNATNTETWEMRYMVNEEYFQAGGPIFIKVGGEWEIGPGTISSGIFVDIAKEHNGILYYTEHRYYGKSKPTKDIQLDNLKYLHVKQALADLAYFIRTKRETNPDLANSKVIMSGGSYAATMVVWFRKLYPELLAGGFASSAPLLAQLDFPEYLEVVGKTMRVLGSEKCYNRIQNGIAELEEMVMGKRSAEAKAMLKLCNNFNANNDLDRAILFSSLAYVFAGIVQYQKNDDIEYYCDYLMSFEDDVSALSNFWLWAYEYPSGCIDATYKGNLDWYMDSSYIHGYLRPWVFQTCNEYGWFATSTSKNQPFGTQIPLDMDTSLCHDTFGSEYSPADVQRSVDATNVEFGGMYPNVDKIYMTHGELDPWNPMGHGEAEGATILPNASHCADVGSISSSDTKEMRESKERLMELIREWLA